MGGGDFLKGIKRYCLWIRDEKAGDAMRHEAIRNRVNLCKSYRESAGRDAKKYADRPHRFAYRKHQENKTSIVIPMTSSQRRKYMPVGYFSDKVVFSNGVFIIYNPELYIFGILSSLMHMEWTRLTSGKLKTDIRYSVNYSYNTFPFPSPTEKQKSLITEHVYNILDTRERYPERTIAEMYDPDSMPTDLLQAHEMLDEVVEKIYRNKPFEDNEERLEHLIKVYEEMINSENEK